MAKHKAKIAVNEKGTVAAAVTFARLCGVNIVSIKFDLMFLQCGLEMPPPEEFICDRPFLYFIRKGEEIIFAGRVVKPISETVKQTASVDPGTMDPAKKSRRMFRNRQPCTLQ